MTPDKLSDEEFCALLVNGADTGNAEAAELKSTLNSYRHESLVWAQRRSAAMPSLAPAARRQGIWAAVPQWTLAAVAAMTVTVGVVHFANASRGNTQEDAPIAMEQTADNRSTASQLDDDNELLHSIDAAVNAGSGLPARDLVQSTGEEPHSHGSME
jgi:anti-sigma-K factor RskA